MTVETEMNRLHKTRTLVLRAAIGFAACCLGAAAWLEGSNAQYAIDRDTAALVAANDDGVIIEQLASGIRDADDSRFVIADIAIGGCAIDEAKLIVAKNEPTIQMYTFLMQGNSVAFTDADDFQKRFIGMASVCGVK